MKCRARCRVLLVPGAQAPARAGIPSHDLATGITGDQRGNTHMLRHSSTTSLLPWRVPETFLWRRGPLGVRGR